MRQKGFTLAELSIVLVIIALLLGGVAIGGSALIESAKVSSLISQIKDLSAAAREFKARYGYYPGDLPNAATLITLDGGVSAACSYPVSATVGNGLVDTPTESACAIEHLVKARLLNKVDIDPITGNLVIRHPFGGGVVTLTTISTTTEIANAIAVTNLPCNIALQVDAKLDSVALTPLSGGVVTGLDSSNAAINTCIPGGVNDPVAVLLVRY